MSYFDFDELNTEVYALETEKNQLSTPRGRKLAKLMKQFDSITVRHSAYTAAMTSVLKTIQRTVMPNSAILVGPAGVGKSFMVAEIERLFSGPTAPLKREPAPGADPLPVLSVTLSSDATLKSALQDLCSELDHFPAKGMTVAAMEKLFLKALEARGVCLIIVDELQNITGGPKQREIVQKWLKNVPNLAKVPMLLVGNLEITEILFDRQIQRRFKRVNLSAIPWESARGNEFSTFVESFISKSMLPEELLSPIIQGDNLARLYIQTGGFPSDVVRLFDSAIMAAYATKSSAIGKVHIEFACQDLQEDLYFSARYGFDHAWQIPDKRLTEYVHRIQSAARAKIAA